MKAKGLLASSVFVLLTGFASPTFADTCCLTGSITATPTIVHLPDYNTRGSTSLSWTWDEPYPYPFTWGCVYVSMDGATPTVVDCEHRHNHYTTNIPWIVAPHVYTFGIAAQNSTMTQPGPVFITQTTVRGVVP